MNISRLKEIREDRDLYQIDIANKLNIKQQQYSEYEIGKRLIPINYLSKLADIYDTSIDYLLGKTDIKKPYPKSILNEVQNEK
ncbi:MAG: helix-turn-helix transcriptional regulator [Bacilli bacterium]|nr:helix-turn-helix transcriptional regulator [Bacilli bacterium]